MKKYNKRRLLRTAMTILACASIAPIIIRAEQGHKKTTSSAAKAQTTLPPGIIMPRQPATVTSVKPSSVQTAPNKTKTITTSNAPILPPAIIRPTHVTTLTANSLAPAHPGQAPAEQGHIWNLENADIRSVINEVAKETGKNFVIDPRVSGQVNMISTKPLPPKALYSVFLTMLEVYGFSAIENNHVVQIVPDLSASQLNSPLATDAHPGSGDQVVVRVIPVKYISSTQLVPILRPLLPQWSALSAYPPSNLIIASGNAGNLERISNIIKSIDVISNNDASIIPLKNANADQVVKILKDLQSSAQTNGGSTATVSIDADDRTNSVILSGNETERLRLSVIITQLDAPSSTDQGHTQVIFLSYLNAKKLAPILDKIATAQHGGGSSDNLSSDSSSTSGSSGKGSSNSDDISKLTSVLPEEDDNALIINAPESLMQSLKTIIQQLDVRPEQVFVQAIIVELDSNSLDKLGVQWGTFMGSNTTNTDGSSSSGGLTGDFAGGTGVGVIQNGHFAALAAAIKGLSGADILSEPTIMVQNNQKATFNVGQQISVQNSQQGSLSAPENSNGVPSTLTTFQQEDVGLKLVVTPQINRGNSVQLLIDQTNGSLQDPENPGTTPVINQSEIKTSVLVNSGDILILGGLMSNSMTTSTYETPLLGDIPILGHLFSYTSHQLEKKDLIVFLKPVIINTPLDGTNITDKKYQYVRNLQLHWTYQSAKDDNPNNRLLPPRDADLPLPKPFGKEE